MYLLIEIRHEILLQCLSKGDEVEKIHLCA